MKIRPVVLVGVLALQALPTFSGEIQKKTYEMDEVLVKASRAKVPEYVQDVIEEQEVIRPTSGGSVLDVLNNEAGIQFRRSATGNSGGGRVRLRGFDETRLKILVDGVPVRQDGSYGGGSVPWSTLSTENIERIEIHRGAGPAKFGDTLGGVINIIRKKAAEKPETLFSTTYGTFDTWDTKVSHSGGVGPLKWSLGAGHFATEGYLRNNDMDRNTVSTEVSLDLPAKFKVALGLDYSDMETGMGVYNRPDSPFYDPSSPTADELTLGGPGTRMAKGALTWGDGSYADDQNSRFSASLSKVFEKGSAKLGYQLWNREKTEYFYDAADSSKKIYERNTEIEDNNWSVQGDLSYSLNRHEIGIGGEFRKYGWGDQSVSYIDTSYFSRSINFFSYIKEGFEGAPDNKTYAALYAQDIWRITPAWDLELGLRQEWFQADRIDPAAFGFQWETEEAEVDESNLDPRLALTWRGWKDGSLTGRFGIVHRYPTSPEHFWWYLNKGSGFFNTELGVEAAKQYELAFTQSLNDIFRVNIRAYFYDIDDYIGSTFVPGVGSVIYNIDSVEVRGLEAECSVQLPRNFRLWANLTLQSGDKKGDPWDAENRLSNELPDFPDTMFNAGIAYQGKRLRSDLSLNYVGARDHYSGKEAVELDDYMLVNLSASYRIWEDETRRLEFLLAGENLLDTDFEEKEGYPMPGAIIMGGVRTVF
ncbi:MAG: TonB-dependent receptor [Candidatus Electrothrix sp. AW3_4]|nr:TonB-dependent receptor [Candidatus Electrothrix gigas]